MSEDVVVLVGNPRPRSRTRTVAEATAANVICALVTAGTPLTGCRVLELAEIAAVSFGPEPARPSTVVPDAHDVVRRARLLVLATPTYKGTYTGLLKTFLDQYRHRELTGVVAVPVAIAASPAHQESVAATLTALLTELGATVPAPPFVVPESQLADVERLVQEWTTGHVPSLVDAFGAPYREWLHA